MEIELNIPSTKSAMSYNQLSRLRRTMNVLCQEDFNISVVYSDGRERFVSHSYTQKHLKTCQENLNSTSLR